MDEPLAEALRLQKLPEAIGADLAVAGGILRCARCQTEQPLGDVGRHLAHGWRQHCGATMAWITAKMLAWEARQPGVPEGYHLEAVPAASLSSGGDWRIDATRRCRQAAYGRKACGAQSAAVLMRSYGNGTRPWGYCADHMYGRFVEGGQVMCWILKADGDG